MKTSKTEAKDPICGMNVDETSPFHAERDGKSFYFCSDHCLQKFNSAPIGKKSGEKPHNCCG
jgi:Cu+-exporting ATPase